ncbi:uncharacterized protein [Diabrotica undecimpunctata]|uniref:uncharacterized protein n=1 Tax=Diabrotica undecimpunctata TaxID=50387 RepID=UPI003B636E67
MDIILPVLKEIFYSENLKFFDVQIDENSNKSIHMGSNLLFAKVSIVDEHEKAQEIPLAIKVGKSKLDASTVANGCRESTFFREIVPLFDNLQAELKIKNKFCKIPKCYKTLIKDGYEIIVLENLSFSGWSALDLTEMINPEGQEVIAKHVAQYHALSFALRHLHKEIFDEHTKDFNMINRGFIAGMIDVFQGIMSKIENILEESNKQETLLKFRKLMKTVNGQTMVKIIDDKPKEVVVVHGDLQRFNFMYKFKDKSCGSISDAMLIDFQVAGIHSPVLDLTYYFFTSVNIPYKASDFLKCYYDQLATSLKELSCDANKLFPYSTLLEHWNKYAFYGFCFAASFMKLGFSEGALQKSSNGTIETFEEPADIGKNIRDTILNAKITNDELYKLTLINLTEKYLESTSIQ